MTIRTTLAAALAAVAIATPAAVAQPADMHASTAQAAAQAQQRQDLRSADARDAATNPRKSQAVNAPGATVVESQSKVTPVAPGQPTWAVNPKPLPPPTQHVSTTSSDDGVDWGTIGIGLAGTLLVLGGIAVLTSRTRSTRRSTRARPRRSTPRARPRSTPSRPTRPWRPASPPGP